jgi:hypothetical protein
VEKKKKKSVLFYLGFRAFADQFESLCVCVCVCVCERERERERERDSFFFPLARMPSEGGAEKWVLPAHDKLQKGKKLMLIILDGWGEQIADQFNAIAVANTPIMDHLKTVRNKDFSTSQCHPPLLLPSSACLLPAPNIALPLLRLLFSWRIANFVLCFVFPIQNFVIFGLMVGEGIDSGFCCCCRRHLSDGGY